MFICFEKYSSVINLDLFWKHLFSHTWNSTNLLNTTAEEAREASLRTYETTRTDVRHGVTQKKDLDFLFHSIFSISFDFIAFHFSLKYTHSLRVFQYQIMTNPKFWTTTLVR
jgi:hypothetical protein